MDKFPACESDGVDCTARNPRFHVLPMQRLQVRPYQSPRGTLLTRKSLFANWSKVDQMIGVVARDGRCTNDNQIRDRQGATLMRMTQIPLAH
jgi:hypothetical protein